MTIQRKKRKPRTAFNMNVTPTFRDFLRATAKKNGISFADLIRIGVILFLRRFEPEADLSIFEDYEEMKRISEKYEIGELLKND